MPHETAPTNRKRPAEPKSHPKSQPKLSNNTLDNGYQPPAQDSQQRGPTRQAIVDAARANFVKGTGRFAPPHSPPPATSIPHPANPPPRPNSVTKNPTEKKHSGGLWEASTIGSLLDDSRVSDPAAHPLAAANGTLSAPPPPRSAFQFATRGFGPVPSPADGRLFTINQNGRFNLGGEPPQRPGAGGAEMALLDASADQRLQPATTTTAVAAAPPQKLTQAAINQQNNLYAGLQQPQPRALMPVPLPFRDREASQSMRVERDYTVGYASPYTATHNALSHSLGGSQFRTTVEAAGLAAHNDGAGEATQHDGGVVVDAKSDNNEDEDDQPTPRASRLAPSQTPTKATRTKTPPRFSQTPTAAAGLQQGLALKHPRTASSAWDRARPKKRKNHDMDYDESALRKMSYSNLANEPFDYDPVVGNSPVSPGGNTSLLCDRLKHYKSKDVTAQSDFFKTLTVGEWEEAGDWFLEQFGSLLGQLKTARANKRKLCQEFEGDIEKRHVLIQSKMEAIDRTMGKLKDEGEHMMKDKEI